MTRNVVKKEKYSAIFYNSYYVVKSYRIFLVFFTFLSFNIRKLVERKIGCHCFIGAIKLLKIIKLLIIMERKGQRKFSLLQINLKESQSKIATIIIFVVEVKQMNSLLISFYFTLRSPSPFLFLFSLSSYHPCSRSRWLPHSRLPLHPVQPLSTIRRTITFRSTTLPTSSSLYSRTVLFSAQESSSIIDSEVIPGKKVLLQTRRVKCDVLRLSVVSHAAG